VVEAHSLSVAFMRLRPAQAARVLEAMPAADAAALFARVPARLGANVLAAMLPTAAARSIGQLDDERAMELIGGLGLQPAVALLRHVAEPRRARLIAGLPTATALASRALLGYAEDSVGAWTNPDVIALPGHTTVREALERVRGTRAYADDVFVAEADQRLAGRVALAELLRAAENAPLGTLAATEEALLAAHTPLAGAMAHPGWAVHGALPVVEQGRRLIGVLTREALTNASTRIGGLPSDEDGGTLTGMLARGYWEALSGILQAAAALMPRIGPVNRRSGGTHDKH
jgi:magnesium transporter